jgi:hypothetical protein
MLDAPTSCPARIDSEITQTSPPAAARTPLPYRHSRKSPTVRNPRSEAICHRRGPAHTASTKEPSAADPFHHQAPSPI